MKTSIINSDPHHCICYSINPLDIEDFDAELRNLGFHYPLLDQERSQILSIVLTNGDDKQIHIKVMPDGQIEAEIEPFKWSGGNSDLHRTQAANDLIMGIALPATHLQSF